MSGTKRPGQDTGNNGGIYREVGPRGGERENFTTVPDNTPVAPDDDPRVHVEAGQDHAA